MMSDVCNCTGGSAADPDTVGGVLGTIIIILLLLLILSVTALLYPCLIRPRMSKNKHLARISKLLDSKIYNRLGYVSTSAATTPTAAAHRNNWLNSAAGPTQSQQPTVHDIETMSTLKELQPPMEYSLFGPPGEYDYVDSTGGAGSYPGPGVAENNPGLYSYASINRVLYDSAEVHQDVQTAQNPLEYEVPVGTQQPRESAAAGSYEEYSHLKHH